MIKSTLFLANGLPTMLLAGGHPSQRGAFHWTDVIPAIVLAAAITGLAAALSLIEFRQTKRRPTN